MSSSSTDQAAAAAAPSNTTFSSIVSGAVSGSHVLKIDGYSRTKGVATGVPLNSRSFRVGGRSWHLAYLPNGENAQSADYISLFLVLDDAAPAPVLAHFTIAVLDRSGRPVPSLTKGHGVHRFAGAGANWGFNTFVRRDALEKSRHLNARDDSFSVRCDLTVVTHFRTHDAATAAVVAAFARVPPPDLARNLGDLLRSERGADVRFRVEGEDIPAHRCVLAARSPVFQAQLFGGMMEASAAAAGSSSSSSSCLVVEIPDMRADVFRKMLNFIYTDALPEAVEGEEEPKPEPLEEAHMAQHLLVAADRYGVDRLKLVCEHILCRHIGIHTVATTLALAEQHRCRGLKEACFFFLKQQSPASLNAVMATDGFDHLAVSCPAVIKELMVRLAAANNAPAAPAAAPAPGPAP